MPTTINPSGDSITQYNVQIGAANNLTANVAPSATSGVPVISQGAASNPVFGTCVVQGGGTGATTLTNHGVLIGQATSAVVATAAGSAGQILQSGGASADPTYSTATYPSTATGTGKVLVANGTNWVASTPTFPNASATSGKFIQSDGTNWIASTPTLPTTAGTSGKVLISDGTNFVSSTPTFPNASATSGKFIQSDGTNWIASTPTIPSTAGTSGKVLISDGTNFVSSTPTFPNASATTRKIIVSDGTNWVASTETWATPSTSGNVLTSNGTNWVSSTPKNSGLVFVSSQTASSSASIIFTNLNVYPVYFITISGCGPATNTQQLELLLSSDNGSNYNNSGYANGINYSAYNSTTVTNFNSTTYVPISNTMGNSNTLSAQFFLFNTNIGSPTVLSGFSTWSDSGAAARVTGAFLGAGTTGTTAIKFQYASGNIAAGTFTLYGLTSS